MFRILLIGMPVRKPKTDFSPEEKTQKAIPYGIGSYEMIRERNLYYVDKTPYLREIEKTGYYLFFIRPRRFGKSLFLAMMETYYDVNMREEFEYYFKDTDIFDNPTPERNSYLVLKFDFSGIASSSIEKTEISFLHDIKNQAQVFISKYKHFFDIDPKQKIKELMSLTNPSDVLSDLLTICRLNEQNIYIIIDEYDNFANTILSTRGRSEYEKLTHGEGFFKSFFATIKKGTTGSGAPIGRLFMTGVSPITLDDVTSGFNIGDNISIDESFNEMMGFREKEVIELIEYYRKAGKIRHETPYLLDIMSRWYNNYRFSKESDISLFNSTLVMYFLKQYQKNYQIPEDLIDRNVRTDYSKLRHLIIIDKMGDIKTNGNFSKLKAVLDDGYIYSKIEKAFPLKNLAKPENFYSLLFYFGLLTIESGGEKEQLKLVIPNETIKKLYYEYILEVYSEMEALSLDLDEYYGMMDKLAYNGEWKPLFNRIAERMENSLGLRDLIKGEKAVQTFLLVYLGLSNLYLVHSEKELNKGYADIVMEPWLANYEGIKYSYLIEIKYMGTGKDELEQLKAEAENQLKNYNMDEKFRKSIQKTTLIKLVLVFSGLKPVYIGEVS
jgi:hypothetical protein